MSSEPVDIFSFILGPLNSIVLVACPASFDNYHSWRGSTALGPFNIHTVTRSLKMGGLDIFTEVKQVMSASEWTY